MIYRILFIGVGSIACRHITNVCTVLKDRKIGCTIDVVRSGNGLELDTKTASLINRYYTIDEHIDQEYDILFITNPTALHYKTIKQFAFLAKHIFIEKPVFESVDYDIGLLNLASKTCYVACPLRYTKVLQHIKKTVDPHDVFCARSICSSYLPDWRPNIDYRQTYSAHKSLGGGVTIDLIHEWDYLIWLFGLPERVMSLYKHISDLEIETEDIALYIAENKKQTIEVHLDYFGIRTIRQLQLFLKNETIIADIAEGTIAYLTHNEILALHEGRNTFQQAEISHFLDIILDHADNDNDLENAINVLRIAQGGYQ